MYQNVQINTGGGSQFQPVIKDPRIINDAGDVVDKIAGLFNVAIYLLVALAVVFIVWNVVMYIVKGNDSEAKKEASKSVSWGILGLAIIVSIWGLVNILVGTFRTGTDNLPNLPNADFVNKRAETPNTINSGGPGNRASSGLIDAPAGWGQQYNNAI